MNRLFEAIDQLEEFTLNEARTQLWQTAYDAAIRAGVPEDQAESFIEYIWQKGSGLGGLRVPAKVKKYIQELVDQGEELPEDIVGHRVKYEDGKYIPTGEVFVKEGIGKTVFASLPEKIIKAWYDLVFAPIYSHENTSNVRKKIDLEQYLMKAREIVASAMGREYMTKNDTRPKIRYGETGPHTLGFHRERDNSITISKAFTLSEDLIDEYMLNTVVHEFIHSLRSCTTKNLEKSYKGDSKNDNHQDVAHSGEWKRVADLVTQHSSCNISRYAQYQEGIAFHNALKKLGLE